MDATETNPQCLRSKPLVFFFTVCFLYSRGLSPTVRAASNMYRKLLLCVTQCTCFLSLCFSFSPMHVANVLDMLVSTVPRIPPVPARGVGVGWVRMSRRLLSLSLTHTQILLSLFLFRTKTQSEVKNRRVKGEGVRVTQQRFAYFTMQAVPPQRPLA